MPNNQADVKDILTEIITDIIRRDTNFIREFWANELGELAQGRYSSNYDHAEHYYEDLIVKKFIESGCWGRVIKINNNEKTETDINNVLRCSNIKLKKYELKIKVQKFTHAKGNEWLSVPPYEGGNEIDIILKQVNGDDRIGIEVKKFYRYLNKRESFAYWRYNFLYNLPPLPCYPNYSIIPYYNMDINPFYWDFFIDSKKTENKYILNGGCVLKDNQMNSYLGWWNEGQIWWDINRLLHLKENFQVKKIYFVGFVQKTDDIIFDKFIEKFKDRIKDLINFYNNDIHGWIYKENKKNNNLERYKKLNFECQEDLDRRVIIVESDKDKNDWVGFIIDLST